MFTKRLRYIVDRGELQDYIEIMGQFHDYILGGVTYDSENREIKFMIEEDKSEEDQANAKALIWSFHCQGVSDLKLDLDCFFTSYVYDCQLRPEGLFISLLNGDVNFQFQHVSLGIPSPGDEIQDIKGEMA